MWSRDLRPGARLTRRKIQRPTGQCQQQSEHFHSIPLMVFGHPNALVGTDPTLPDHEHWLQLHHAIRISLGRQRESREEEVVDEDIHQLLAERRADLLVLLVFW